MGGGVREADEAEGAVVVVAEVGVGVGVLKMDKLYFSLNLMKSKSDFDRISMRVSNSRMKKEEESW